MLFTRQALVIAVTLLCACNLSQRLTKTEWTVPEVKEWSEKNKSLSTWKGWILYQGSDSTAHHFIGRVMDEWRWFNIKREELALEDVRPYISTSAGPLGYYYVDPLMDFRKVKEYNTSQ